MLRRLHKLYADTFGYFWLPCPLCSRMFGGHEAGEMLRVKFHRGEFVCRECSEYARAYNELAQYFVGQ